MSRLPKAGLPLVNLTLFLVLANMVTLPTFGFTTHLDVASFAESKQPFALGDSHPREDRARVALPSCISVDVPKSGLWWIEMRTNQRSTAPGLLILPADSSLMAPRLVGRTEGLLVAFCEPGKQIVCLTSQAPLDEVEVVAQSFAKGGDPLETEIDPDPILADVCGADTDKGGDPLETEIDPDP